MASPQAGKQRRDDVSILDRWHVCADVRTHIRNTRAHRTRACAFGCLFTFRASRHVQKIPASQLDLAYYSHAILKFRACKEILF